MNETIVWNKLAGSEPPEEIGLLLYYKGEVFWGDWDGKDFRDAYTGLTQDVEFWAIVKGPQ
jgi:hypothetical protein